MMRSAGIKPGTVVGILGDGQLGRLEIIRNAHLGLSFAVLGPGGKSSPAGQLASWVKPWNRRGTVTERVLNEFCSQVSVVTIETESVSLDLVEQIEAKGKRVYPALNVLQIARDRLLEKQFAQSLGIPVAPYRVIGSRADFPLGQHTVAKRSILKTRCGGYDSLGQVVIPGGQRLDNAWQTLRRVPCILEEAVDFAYEFSVIVFRNEAGQVLIYGPFENTHKDGILDVTRYPARPKLSEDALERAINSSLAYAKEIAERLELVGILTIENFILENGAVLFNEMAPRVHNSGHLTMDCFDTCQYEQYVRAACGLPFGSANCQHAGVMTNLIGADIEQVPKLLTRDVKLYLYGKSEVRPRRKMGHYTECIPLSCV
ncbi:MAG: 5-(carboxyamino)imidazole ribonucleotide synthase [Candidatus Kaiserbacteria bacterium]|nr:5-(carboxyamino)imidazole ribonucleotide synthase [Candidatus Kaiserbacteria bacterium]